MKLNSILVISILSFLAQGNPVALPEPAALADPIALPEPVADADPAVLFKRDRTCSVSQDGVNCRKGAGTGYDVVRKINLSDRFGVRCKANGQSVYGNVVWDRIPGWSCWVSAHYTNSGCETGVPWC